MKQKKITLGIINPSDFSKKLVSGGASGFLGNILPYLNAQRTIIFGIGLKDTIPWKTYHLSANVDFVAICNLRFPSKIPMRLKVLIYYILYRNRILNSGVDVLYVQMPECCIPFLNNKKAIPVIYHKHGSANPVSRSKFIYGRTVLFRKFYEIVLLLIYKKANWIITIDRLSLQTVIENGAKNRTSLLMNAVDTEKYYPDSILRDHARKGLGLAENIFVLLFVGRIEKTKGPGRLLDCIPFLKEAKYPFHIFFAGEGTYKSYLEKRVRAKHYDASVTFLGFVPHEELSHFYNVAYVMVLPSETEGVPMVILEALACGTPVIASKVGGIPDLVFDGINGIVLDDLTPEKLTSAIINILSKKIERKRIARSVKNYSARNFVKFFNNIIWNVLNKCNNQNI
jgi:glycosyltransferase involved in cell wall biosynthesis